MSFVHLVNIFTVLVRSRNFLRTSEVRKLSRVNEKIWNYSCVPNRRFVYIHRMPLTTKPCQRINCRPANWQPFALIWASKISPIQHSMICTCCAMWAKTVCTFPCKMPRVNLLATKCWVEVWMAYPLKRLSRHRIVSEPSSRRNHPNVCQRNTLEQRSWCWICWMCWPFVRRKQMVGLTLKNLGRKSQ